MLGSICLFVSLFLSFFFSSSHFSFHCLCWCDSLILSIPERFGYDSILRWFTSTRFIWLDFWFVLLVDTEQFILSIPDLYSYSIVSDSYSYSIPWAIHRGSSTEKVCKGYGLEPEYSLLKRSTMEHRKSNKWQASLSSNPCVIVSFV